MSNRVPGCGENLNDGRRVLHPSEDCRLAALKSSRIRPLQLST